MDPLKAFARRIRAVEKLAFKAATQPQLAYSSIEDGAIRSIVDGQLHLIIGKQFDGTQTVAVVNGPPCPTPSAPIVEEALEGLNVRWDGLWAAADAITPMNFGRVEAHASVDPDFPATSADTLIGFFESPRGGVIYANLVPNTYYVKFVSVSQSGVRGVPTPGVAGTPTSLDSVIEDPGGNSLEEPTSSPVLIVNPSAQGFMLRADGATATTQITYHVSAQPLPAIPDITTAVVGPTRRNPVYIDKLPDGITPFRLDIPYYFATVASNGAGDGPKSADVTAQLDPITSERIVSLDVEQLEAGNMFVRGELEATYALFSILKVGTNITIDPDGGITIVQADGKGVTHLAADGSGNQFAGQGTFDSITTKDKLSIEGFKNFLKGTLSLANGVQNPAQAPTVTATWDTLPLVSGAGYNHQGLAEDETGAFWITTDTAGTLASNVQYIEKVGGQISRTFDVKPNGVDWLALGGVACIGNRIYVLACLPDGPSFVKNNWRILIYDAYGLNTYMGSIALGITTSSGYPSIGSNDSGGLTVAWTPVDRNGVLWIRNYDTAGNQVGATVACNGTWGLTQHVTGITRSANHMYNGNSRYIVTRPGGIHIFSLTGVDSTTSLEEGFSTVPGSLRGVAMGVDGFYHTLVGAAVIDHTANSGIWNFAYSWADTDNGSGPQPSPYIDCETMLSDFKEISPARLARWEVRLPSEPPWDGTSNGANTAAIYAAPLYSPMVLQRVLAVGEQTLSRRSWSATGIKAAPTKNGFAERPGALGQLISIKVDIDGRPVLIADGNGEFRAAMFLQSKRQTFSVPDTDVSTVFDVTFPVPFTKVPRGGAFPKTSRPDRVHVTASNETLTGMKIYIVRNAAAGAGDTIVDWFATTAD